ncbi:hypothetical protein ACO2Q0_02525 [Phenylobacterium sp. VNQ135]|uniref:hypothetical protein n=1 Tax=Phenylobacterium sp. VNQ135 TaxID=3400922 RepID=UPI003C115D4D
MSDNGIALQPAMAAAAFDPALMAYDPVINDGTEFFFDFTRDISNPHADGALASGATFRNVARGGDTTVNYPDATLTATGWTVPTGKKGVRSDGDVADRLDLGKTYRHGIDGNHFARTIALKVPASGYDAGAYQTVASLLNSNTTDAEWYVDLGADGQTIRMILQDAVPTTKSVTLTSLETLGVLNFLTFGWNGTQAQFYVNGVLKSSVAMTSVYGGAMGQNTRLRGDAIVDFFLFHGEDLTLSERSIADVAADLYDTHYARIAALIA